MAAALHLALLAAAQVVPIARGAAPPATAPSTVTVPVTVTAAGGAPGAGVSVALWLRNDDHEPQPLVRGRTDATGRARLPLPLEWTALRRGRARVVCAVELAAAAAAEVPIDPAAPAPVELALPATGAIEVELAHDDGEPADPSCHARLRPLGAPDRPAVRGERGESVVRFGLVGVGGRYEVEVWGGWTPFLRRTVQGPRRAGETVRRTLRLGPRPPRRALRVTRGGAPWSGTLALVLDERLGGHGGAQRSFRVEVGGDGAAAVPFAPRAGGDRRHRAFALAVAGDAVLAAAAELDETNGAIGLALQPAPVLLAGRVRDGTGAAVPGVVVGLDAERGGALEPCHGVLTTSGADGSFAFFGWAEGKVAPRVVDPHRIARAAAPVAAGATADVALVAAVQPVVRIRPAAAVEAVLATLDGGEEGRVVGGALRFARRAPGRAVLALRLPGEGEPLWRGEIECGAEVGVDLRPLQVGELEVVDERGAPVPYGVALPLGPDGVAAGGEAIVWRGGRAVVAAAGPDARWALLAPGGRAVEVRAGQTGRVEIGPAHALDVQLADPSAVPAPPRRAVLELLPPGGPRRPPPRCFDGGVAVAPRAALRWLTAPPRAVLDAAGRGELRSAWPGAFVLQLGVETGSAREGTTLRAISRRPVELAPGVTPLRLDLDEDERALLRER